MNLRRPVLPILLALPLAFAACGGTDATELERRLTDGGPFASDDPVIKADCPTSLGAGDDAKVVCTTTTERGVVNRVTVTNMGDGLAFDSEIAATPTPDPREEAAIERTLRRKHDQVFWDYEGLLTDTIVCDDDVLSGEASKGSCVLTMKAGAVQFYDAVAKGERIRAEPSRGHWPADKLAAYIRELDAQKPDRANSFGAITTLTCEADLPFGKGEQVMCDVVSERGKERLIVRATDELGSFLYDLASDDR